jgi:glycosyltransferase involved in cell wall biosynthesis
MQKITLIIPCYNEEKRLQESVFLEYLSFHPDVAILFVNDGSDDNTAERIECLAGKAPLQITYLHLSNNMGKAEAVRRGMLKGYETNHSAWLGYWDADMSTSLAEIDHLLGCAQGEVKILMCSRVRRLGASIDRHLWRHIGGRIMATLLSVLLRLPVYDTQCGAKIIRRDVIESIFSKPFLSKWLFDVEILFRLSSLYPNLARDNSVIEVPVLKWKDVAGSKLKIRHIIRSLIDIIHLYISYRLFK